MCPLPSSSHGREPPGLCRLWQSCVPTPSPRRRRTSPSAPGERLSSSSSSQLCGPQTTHRVRKLWRVFASASTVPLCGAPYLHPAMAASTDEQLEVF